MAEVIKKFKEELYWQGRHLWRKKYLYRQEIKHIFENQTSKVLLSATLLYRYEDWNLNASCG